MVDVNSKVFFYGFNSVIDNTITSVPESKTCTDICVPLTEHIRLQCVAQALQGQASTLTSCRCLWKPETIPNRGRSVTLWKLLGTATSHMGSTSSCRNTSIPALQCTAPNKPKAVTAVESARLGCASAHGDTFSRDKQVGESFHGC